VVTERDGYPAAVLLRALEPLVGLDVMRRRRGTADVRALCSGPGRLCRALGITGGMNGERLDGKRIRVCPRRDGAAHRIAVSPRIGITRAADWPLRFFVRDSAWLSRRIDG
jgi:DNA-3-methyladenine glycosylase